MYYLYSKHYFYMDCSFIGGGGVQGEGLLRGVTEGGGDRKEGLALP